MTFGVTGTERRRPMDGSRSGTSMVGCQFDQDGEDGALFPWQLPEPGRLVRGVQTQVDSSRGEAQSEMDERAGRGEDLHVSL